MAARGVNERAARPGWRTAAMVTGAAIALTIVWFGAPRVLNRLEFFRIRRIEVSGATHHTPRGIVDALMLGRRSSVFDDLDAMQRRIARLPAIESADVGRRLPGTLVVNVIETEPVALAPQRNGTLVPIDLAGRPLPYDPAEAPPDLPIATSPDSLLARVLGVVRDTDPSLFARVTTGAMARDDVVLETEGRRLWFTGDATADEVRAVIAVAEDLARRGRDWRELDGRFAGQVVVRGMGAGA